MKQTFLIFMLILCSSCLDQVDKHYPDYNSIISDKYEKSGWIPEYLLPTSTTNLYSRTNMDLNSFMISYQVNNQDLKLITSKLELSNQDFLKPHGLNLPQWWFKDSNHLETYKIRGDSSIRALAIDKNHNTIYYWGQF